MEKQLRRRAQEKEKKQKKKEEKQLARQQLKDEKKEHGLEDMTLAHASNPPPRSHPIQCEYPEHFGQLLVIYSMLNAFGELLNLRPLQYNDLEMALKESSVYVSFLLRRATRHVTAFTDPV